MFARIARVHLVLAGGPRTGRSVRSAHAHYTQKASRERGKQISANGYLYGYGLSSVLRISLCGKRRSLADFLQTVEDKAKPRRYGTARPLSLRAANGDPSQSMTRQSQTDRSKHLYLFSLCISPYSKRRSVAVGRRHGKTQKVRHIAPQARGTLQRSGDSYCGCCLHR